MKKKIQYIYICLLGALLLGTHSCADDPMINPDYTVSGKPTTVSFKLTLPAMTTVKNRAFLQEDEKNLVKDVWVATYTSEKCTGSKLVEDLSSKMSHSAGSHPNEVTATVTDFTTESGYSYIVAVANVKENFGYPDVSHLGENDRKSLSELLSKADTWDEFCSIVVENNDLNTPGVPLVMSGCFLSETKSADVKWETQNYEKVFIPADGGPDATMVGAIHLRRLVAHVIFNLVPGKDVSLEPQGYRIYNVPKHAYAYERNGENSGDVVTEDTKGQHYMNSNMFDNRYFTAKDNSWTFDFWQLENKHTGKESCTSYNEREKEHKGEGGKNSGIYTSLSGETWTSDNMATYVEIRCRVNRGEVNVGDNGLPSDDGGGKTLNRYGDAVFTVHLGYCEGKGADGKATGTTCRDFNCRRNVDYTYTVTVNDVSNIVVEANGGEPQPGMEGIVNDVENKHIDLDCHYAAFNIQITDEELESTTPGTKFGFVIEAWDAQGNLLTFNEETNWNEVSDTKYADWIELRATTAENVLAEYKPSNYAYSKDDKKTFLLRNFNKDLSSECKSDHNGWYTVFVNEYVYETSTDGNEVTKDGDAPAWAGYVNKPDRRFWIRTVRKKSSDEESVYMRSKYAVSQKSIQTYYSTTNFTEEETVNGTAIPRATAIGAEHVNENRGLNLRQSQAGYDQNNGRYNVWGWLEDKMNDLKWNSVVDFTKLQNIPAVDDIQNVTIAVHNAYLPKTESYTGTISNDPFDPQPNSDNADDYIEAINACMNRNRDNNGDGTIDASELRWYVPAVGKYLRLILGRNSLKTPIMDYDGITKLAYDYNTDYNPNDPLNGKVSSLLLYASNGKVVWAMEGLSTSGWSTGGENPTYARPPWNVRCIRNLGSNLSTVSKGEKVSAAYKHEPDKRRVTMRYYDELSVRTERFDGPLPIHYIYDARPQYNYNRVYKSFEYSPDNAEKEGAFSYDWYEAGIPIENWEGTCKTACDGLNQNGQQGWRVPNQKEMAIMRNIGLFENMPGNDNLVLSCTRAYYDTDGKGITDSSSSDEKRGFMASRQDGGTCWTKSYSNLQFYVRCVRDVEPDE